MESFVDEIQLVVSEISEFDYEKKKSWENAF